MATKYARSDDFRSPDCVVSFAFNLFKPRKANADAAEKYGCTLIFPKSCDRSKLDAALKHCIVETWGDKGLERARGGLIRSPFLDGEGKEARNKTTGELHPGMGPDVFFIRVSSNRAVPVRYTDPNVQATEEEVYSGCVGFAVLNAYAWHNDQNGDGVSFGINYFQKLRDGERLAGSGGIDPEQWHEKIAPAGEAPAETKSGEGAGGLFGD